MIDAKKVYFIEKLNIVSNMLCDCIQELDIIEIEQVEDELIRERLEELFDEVQDVYNNASCLSIFIEARR